MNGWKKIAEFGDEIRAELVNAAFHHAGITTAILDKKDTALIVLGVIEIFVPEEDFDRAWEIYHNLIDEEE